MLDLSTILVCPACRGDLLVIQDPASFQCNSCSRGYPLIGNIPRFVPNDSYAASFGFEWNVHARTQLDTTSRKDSEETLQQKTGLRSNDVKDKLVLDVGCGMGRFADVISRWGGNVVGIDLSRAVESAYENLKLRENVAILQADLFQLPFRQQSFDVIYSIGVLHHTPDCEKAFRSLVKFLKPGGRISIWVYDHEIVWGRIPQFYWRFTRRMNPPLLHSVCRLAGPLYHVVKLPIIGRLLWRILPIDTNPDREWRILDTFDWYSARYRSWHTYQQVQNWFESEELTNIRRLDSPVSVSGCKPLPPNK